MQDPEHSPASGAFSEAPASRFEADDTITRVAAFRFALLEFQQFSDALADEFGIGIRQYQTLLFVFAYPDALGMPMGELARRMHITPATATGLVERMEAKRWLQRVFDTKNRRLVRLKLLQEGLLLLQRIADADNGRMGEIRAAARKIGA
ncbi:MAG: MarR family winged helix-turn-helix transcriptional regulator [Beijerinckiaceae bacterium]